MTFATNIVFAKGLIERTMANGCPARWVMTDTVDGSDDAFRQSLEKAGLNYVVRGRADGAV